MNTRDLLRAMADAYGRAASYADRGVVITTFVHPDRREVHRKPFATLFQRPDRFRFELSDEFMGSRMVIWQETPPARVFWTIENQPKALDLAMAIAGATGISGGSAVTIPRLLMPDLLTAWAVTEIEDPEDAVEEVIGSVRCARICGRHGGSTITMWIGIEDLLLRRMFQADHFGAAEHAAALASVPDDLRASLTQDMEGMSDFDTETDTLYEPTKDLSMPSDAFQRPAEIPP